MNYTGFSLMVLLALQWTAYEVATKSLPDASSLIQDDSAESYPVSQSQFEPEDNQLTRSHRQKRTIGPISRMVTCMLTFLINPNCMNQMGQQRSYSPNYYDQQQQKQMQQYFQMQQAWIRAQNLGWGRYNGTDGNNSSYPYPILTTYPPDQQPTQAPENDPPPPVNPIQAIINAKLNFIPNTLRFLFPNIFGNNRNRYQNTGNNNYNANNQNYGNYNQQRQAVPFRYNSIFSG